MNQSKAINILCRKTGLTLREAMDAIYEDCGRGWPIDQKVRQAYDFMAAKLGEPPL